MESVQPIVKTFGELLRDFRRSRSMTQQEMADRLGLSSPYIAQMESGFKPPPPQAIVEKMSKILRLTFNDEKAFGDSAEAERELQSLVKATRKVGYILAGNKVCVPQKSVSYCTQLEVDSLVDSIPPDVSFHLDLSRIKSRHWNTVDTGASLVKPDDLRAWTLSELGDQPGVWLAFLGLLYEVLILTPDDRLLCRNPSRRRQNVTKYGRDVGIFFQNLQKLIQDAINAANEQRLPEVIAPHEAWKQIDSLLGTDKKLEREDVPPKIGEESIRQIEINHVIAAGTEHLQPQEDVSLLGLPSDWFINGSRYEAFAVYSDAYVSLGVWPGCKAVYELNAEVENEDLVVVRLGDRICIRRYFDMGEMMMLQQGGPLAKPIQVKKNEPSIKIIGVVRELIARFKDVR